MTGGWYTIERTRTDGRVVRYSGMVTGMETFAADELATFDLYCETLEAYGYSYHQ